MSESRLPTAGMDNEIMTIEEVATYLRLKPQTIYKWAQEKRIPAAKLGKEWRFRRSLIELWLDEQEKRIKTSQGPRSIGRSGARR